MVEDSHELSHYFIMQSEISAFFLENPREIHENLSKSNFSSFLSKRNKCKATNAEIEALILLMNHMYKPDEPSHFLSDTDTDTAQFETPYYSDNEGNTLTIEPEQVVEDLQHPAKAVYLIPPPNPKGTVLDEQKPLLHDNKRKLIKSCCCSQ